MAGHYCCVYGCGNNQKETDKSFFRLPSDPEKLAVWLSVIRREDLLETSKSKKLTQRICSDHFGNDHYNCKIIKTLKKNAVPHLNLPDSLQEEPERGPSTSKHNLLSYLQDKSTQTLDDVSTQTTTDLSTQTLICKINNSSNETKFVELRCSSSIQTPLSLTSNTPRETPIKRKLKMKSTSKKLKMLEQNVNIAAEEPVTKDTFLKLCDKFLTKKMSDIVKCHVELKDKFIKADLS